MADLTATLCTIGRDADDRVARQQVFEAVYGELRRVAGDLMRRERPDHTLRPTALVHEAYVRLIDAERVGWENRAHLVGIAARAMRQVLVDHARRHRSLKRGGNLTRVTLDDFLPTNDHDLAADVIDLHDAIEELGRLDARMARVVELRVFGGLTAKEAALVLGCSKRTVDEDWSVARLWLARRLTGSNAEDDPSASA